MGDEIAEDWPTSGVSAFMLNGLALAFDIAAPLIVAALIAWVYSYFVWPRRSRAAPAVAGG